MDPNIIGGDPNKGGADSSAESDLTEPNWSAAVSAVPSDVDNPDFASKDASPRSLSPQINKVMTEAKQYNQRKVSKRYFRNRWYFLLYAMGYIISGLYNCSSIVLLYKFESLLQNANTYTNDDTKTSDSSDSMVISTAYLSLIYLLTNLGSIVGNFVSNTIINVVIPKQSHYYLTVLNFLYILLIIPNILFIDIDPNSNDYETILILILLIWFIFGFYIGTIESVFIIYIYRIWMFKSNIVYNKLQLYYLFGNMLFMLLVVITDFAINSNENSDTMMSETILSEYVIIWYLIIGLSFFSMIACLILPTPLPGTLVNHITEAAIYEIIDVNFNSFKYGQSSKTENNSNNNNNGQLAISAISGANEIEMNQVNVVSVNSENQTQNSNQENEKENKNENENENDNGKEIEKQVENPTRMQVAIERKISKETILNEDETENGVFEAVEVSCQASNGKQSKHAKMPSNSMTLTATGASGSNEMQLKDRTIDNNNNKKDDNNSNNNENKDSENKDSKNGNDSTEKMSNVPIASNAVLGDNNGGSYNGKNRKEYKSSNVSYSNTFLTMTDDMLTGQWLQDIADSVNENNNNNNNNKSRNNKQKKNAANNNNNNDNNRDNDNNNKKNNNSDNNKGETFRYFYKPFIPSTHGMRSIVNELDKVRYAVAIRLNDEIPNMNLPINNNVNNIKYDSDIRLTFLPWITKNAMSNAWFDNEKSKLRQQNRVQLQLLTQLGSINIENNSNVESPMKAMSPESVEIGSPPIPLSPDHRSQSVSQTKQETDEMKASQSSAKQKHKKKHNNKNDNNKNNNENVLNTLHESIESMHGYKQVFIICLLLCLSLSMGYTFVILAYIPYYCTDYLNLNNGESISDVIVFSFYFCFFIGKIVTPYTLKCCKETSQMQINSLYVFSRQITIDSIAVYFLLLVFAAMTFYGTQYMLFDALSNNTNENDITDSETLLIATILVIIYGVSGIATCGIWNLLIVVCDSIQAITQAIGTLMSMTLIAASFIAYGIGYILIEYAGYHFLPLLIVCISVLINFLFGILFYLFHKM